VSPSTASRMNLYPFSPPGVRTCRVYPLPPQTVLTCRVSFHDQQYAPPAVWTCRVYPSPLLVVCTCRVYESLFKIPECWTVRYWNKGTSPVPECSGTRLRYQKPECRCRRHQPRCDAQLYLLDTGRSATWKPTHLFWTKCVSLDSV
jgi:hypothetical protein